MIADTSILVVDDLSVMQDIIVRHLRLLGFSDIHVASNGHDALRQLELRRIGLILSDWSMPGMSGLDLLKLVRADARWRELPFVLVTAELQRELVEQALRAGANDLLLKPFSPAVLDDKLRSVMKGKVRTPPQPAPPVSPAADAMPTVLVVDDTPNNLTLVAGLLRELYKVQLAVRGDKALVLVQQAPPDLILLDIMMPEMDGFEVCRRLKDDPRHAHIPVVFLSALTDVDKVVAGLALGAVDYVTKPIEAAILKARVANALRVAKAQEDLRAQLDLMVENVRLRDDVEHMIRHDLRNPLAVIVGTSAALLEDAALTQNAREQISAIGQAAQAMADLSQFSGDLLKMERGNYVLPQQRVELGPLLQRVADETMLAFRGKQVRVRTAMPPAACFCTGDPLLLYSMLHNLCRNAAEAVWQGEAVELSLGGDRPWQIVIHNPGAVAPEIRARFFEKYATHGKPGGTGLGTYSALMIARAHGGDIALGSSEEQGTTLTITLPSSA